MTRSWQRIWLHPMLEIDRVHPVYPAIGVVLSVFSQNEDQRRRPFLWLTTLWLNEVMVSGEIVRNHILDDLVQFRCSRFGNRQVLRILDCE